MDTRKKRRHISPSTAPTVDTSSPQVVHVYVRSYRFLSVGLSVVRKVTETINYVRTAGGTGLNHSPPPFLVYSCGPYVLLCMVLKMAIQSKNAILYRLTS